jgi:hypothetical protein
LQSPTPPSEAHTSRPPTVIWRFVPEDQSRLRRLLRLLFEQDPEQEQSKIGSERRTRNARKEAMPRATVGHHADPLPIQQAKAI